MSLEDEGAAPVFNFTPRTMEAIEVAGGMDQVLLPAPQELAAEKVAEQKVPPGVLTPRTVEAVKVAHQEVDDETVALQLQQALDEEASAEVVEATMELAKKTATKGKPVKKKKSPKAKAASASSRKVNQEKTTSRFHVDVGESKLTTELDKKLLSKSLMETVIEPALKGYLADKPACVRIPLSKHPDDVTVSVDGEVVDGKAAAKSYVDIDNAETIVIIILPQWAQDIVMREPAAMAEIMGGSPSNFGKKTTTSHGITTVTISASSAPFTVHIKSRVGGKGSFETDTHLNAAWLSKPLFDALAKPAVDAYLKSNPSAPQVRMQEVTMSVDGKAVDGKAPASQYVHDDGSPALVELWLPMAIEIRIH